jgi:MFS family permease
MSHLPGSPAYGLALSKPPPDGSNPWPTFWLAVGGTFLAYLDVTIVNIAFPDIASDFHGSGLGSLSWCWAARRTGSAAGGSIWAASRSSRSLRAPVPWRPRRAR